MAQPLNAAPRVFAGEAPLAGAAAEFVAARAAEAVAARGAFRLALPGGRTPRALLARLAALPEGAVAWARVTLLFVDERALPPTDPESNYALVREALLAPLGARAPQVRRMRGEAADVEAAAREYEAELEMPLDLAVLGVGEDGHVASLFPGSALLAERARRVAAVFDSPKPPPHRLTLTPRALAEARAALVLAAGAGKRAAVTAALAPAGEVARCPARLLRGATWMLTADAAPAG